MCQKPSGANNLVHLGVSVCHKALLTELDEAHVDRLEVLVADIAQEDEKAVMEVVMGRGNLTGVVAVLPNIFPNAGATTYQAL